MQVAAHPAQDALDAAPLLDHPIGTHLDGSISLSQVCRLIGVTVAGTIAPETDPEAIDNSDLSGATTYWEAWLDRVTLATSHQLLTTCRACFPKSLLVQAVTDENFRGSALAPVGETAIEDRIWLISGATDLSQINFDPERGVLPKDGQLHILADFTPWRYPAPRYTSMVAGRASKDLGRTLIEPGIRGLPERDALTYATFSLRANFSTGDRKVRSQLAQLGHRLMHWLPETPLEWIDLKTDDVLSRITQPMDPVLTMWCDAGPDRWLAISRDGPGGPWKGLRPSRA